MTRLKARRYDLILDDGQYCINCLVVGWPKVWRSKLVADALLIRGVYGLPWLGALLRNFWAKRRGAYLSNILHG